MTRFWKQWQADDFETCHVRAMDGLPLLLRSCEVPGSQQTVFVGHGPTVHSGFTLDFCRGLAQAGLSVWAGDLRGHGGSLSTQQPLGHLDPFQGWGDLIEDMSTVLNRVFAGVPWTDRVVVGPSISGLLILEVLKREPHLARQIVLVSPTPRQPALMALARAFVRVRMMVNRSNCPDPQVHHHLFNFLGAHLTDRQHLADIISTDRGAVNAVLRDPQGFPIHTLGYWASIFAGNEQVWEWPAGSFVAAGTRVLLLYGSEDSQMRSGAFAPMVLDWLRARGIEDVTAQVVEGARSNVLIDEPRLGVAAQVLAWLQQLDPIQTSLPPARLHPKTEFKAKTDFKAAYENALLTLGMTAPNDDSPYSESLVGLCYAALDDEDRWTELIYRLALAEDPEDRDIQQLIEQVLPHLERSFELKQQLLSQASMGDLLHTLVERLDIGVALLSNRGAVLECNQPYRTALTRILSHENQDWYADDNNPTQLTRQLIQGLDLRSDPLDERLVVYEGQPVGWLVRPRALKQKVIRLEGPTCVLVLRSPAHELPDVLHRVQLLELAYGLTRQEGIVALLVAQGQSTDAIATALSVTIHTIRTHLKRCFEKVGVAGRTELATRLLSGPIGWLGVDQSRIPEVTLPTDPPSQADYAK